MRYFVVDAFSDKAFDGNPAGVCVVDDPIDDEIMQKIAFENNLAETAFFTPKNGYYDLRWFTPKIEIDLYGHATLASAYIIRPRSDNEAKIITQQQLRWLLEGLSIVQPKAHKNVSGIIVV